jgi:CheY-like chemotaxis protein
MLSAARRRLSEQGDTQAIVEAPTGSTVIVADDHPLFREALIHAVAKVMPGAAIVEADSLESLQQAVEANGAADLLLLDLNMPGVSGFSALAWIRQNHASLPTIVVSAIDDPNVMRRALAARRRRLYSEVVVDQHNGGRYRRGPRRRGVAAGWRRSRRQRTGE